MNKGTDLGSDFRGSMICYMEDAEMTKKAEATQYRNKIPNSFNMKKTANKEIITSTVNAGVEEPNLEYKIKKIDKEKGTVFLSKASR